MEKLPNKDINRMIAFIKHEAEEKVKEIEIKGIEEYNNEKARVINQEMLDIQANFERRRKEIEIRRHIEESKVLNMYKLEYAKMKYDAINKIFSDLENIVKDMRLTEELVKESVDKMEDKEFYVLCKDEDKKVVRKLLSNVEIKHLCDEGLGGIILISKDHKSIIDNSYKTRIETVRKYYCDKIANMIYK